MYTKELLEDSIQKGVSALTTNGLSQKDNGEFPAYMLFSSESGEYNGDQYNVKLNHTPFITPFTIDAFNEVLKSDIPWANNELWQETIKSSVRKGIKSLLDDMEIEYPYGFFRYFGRNSIFVHDIDTTAGAQFTLHKNKTHSDEFYNSVANKMLEYRDNEGVFVTYIDSKSPAHRDSSNVATALRFFASLGRTREVTESIEYLNNELMKPPSKIENRYYISPYATLYFANRAFKAGVKEIEDNLKSFRSKLVEIKEYDKNPITQRHSNINTAIRIITASPEQRYDTIFKKDVKHLIDSQIRGDIPELVKIYSEAANKILDLFLDSSLEDTYHAALQTAIAAEEIININSPIPGSWGIEPFYGTNKMTHLDLAGWDIGKRRICFGSRGLGAINIEGLLTAYNSL